MVWSKKLMLIFNVYDPRYILGYCLKITFKDMVYLKGFGFWFMVMV
jgi:hypothetical protein